MLDTNDNCTAVTSEEASSEEQGLIINKDVDLNKESLALIEQIISETDEQKTKDLTHLFNNNQNKKTMVRVNKLSDLLDTITEQALTRFTSRPDEISNKELFDGLKVVQDLIERGQKQVSGSVDLNTPLIQFNQQTNEVNIGDPTSQLSRDSRERVKSVVLNLLSDLTAKSNTEIITEPSTTDVITVEEQEIKEDLNNG